ncbi:MAG: geranylgeranyl reductase family protein [Nitrospirae bacterium]|nr:geranylgeranyl reductase family protein [Nitrospirota bacterium]
MRVLIVGGGPAGAVAARDLARAGIETTLIERAPHGAKPCGGAVSFAAFGEFGIPSSVIERSVRTLTLVSPRGARADIVLDDSPLVMVRRQTFDSALREMARAAGAVILHGNVARAWADPSPGVRVTTDGGRTTEIGGDVLLAADGANSVVARSLGRAVERTCFGIQEWMELSPALAARYGDRCEFHFRADVSPDFYGWVFPKKETLTVGTGTALSRARTLPRLLAALKRSVGPDLADKPVLRREVFPIPIGRIGPIGMTRPSLFVGPILFLGDAAGLVMPTSGEGIYYAMKSGEIAARAVRDNSARPGRIGRAYAAEWKRAFDRRYAVMSRLQDFFYRDDDRREKLVAIHGLKGIPEISRSLWLDRDLSARTLLSYSRSLFAALKEAGSQGRIARKGR